MNDQTPITDEQVEQEAEYIWLYHATCFDILNESAKRILKLAARYHLEQTCEFREQIETSLQLLDETATKLGNAMANNESLLAELAQVQEQKDSITKYAAKMDDNNTELQNEINKLRDALEKIISSHSINDAAGFSIVAMRIAKEAFNSPVA